MGGDFCSRDPRFTGHFWGSFAAFHATSLIGGDAAGSTSGTTVLKWRTFAGFLQAMRIELNYQADSLPLSSYGSPESITTRSANMDSGLAALRRPGMTTYPDPRSLARAYFFAAKCGIT